MNCVRTSKQSTTTVSTTCIAIASIGHNGVLSQPVCAIWTDVLEATRWVFQG